MLKGKKKERVLRKDVTIGDYIYIISQNEYVKIIELDGAFNAIDKEGNYCSRYSDSSPDLSMTDFKRYLESWEYTWDWQIDFFRELN